MKKRFVSVFFILVGLLLISQGCKKQEIVPENVGEVGLQNAGPTIVSYFYDGVSVPSFNYEEDSDMRVLTILGTELDPTANEVAILGFSNEALMLSYADANNIPLRNYVEGGHELALLAENSGVIDEYELTGNCPQWYFDEIESRFPSNKTEVYCTYNDNCFGGSLPAVVSNYQGMPFMYLGWDNRVSAYFNMGVYSIMLIYDKTFYRKNILNVWNWGWQTVSLCTWYPWANNKMSSSIH